MVAHTCIPSTHETEAGRMWWVWGQQDYCIYIIQALYTLWCLHEQQNYLTILFFFEVYITTWCTEAHKNKKIAMDRGVRGDSSGEIGWISIQKLCGYYYVDHWAPGVWWVRQNQARVLWAALGIRGVAGGKLVICSSLSQHSEEIAPRQHLEESEAQDTPGRLRAQLQRLGQNRDSIY